MSELVTYVVDYEIGAGEMRIQLEKLIKTGQLTVVMDAAILVRTLDGTVKAKRAATLASKEKLGDPFWSWLVRQIAWVGGAELELGALPGGIPGVLADYGVTEQYIKGLEEAVKPAHSAMLLFLKSPLPKDVAAKLEKYKARIYLNPITPEQVTKIRQAFAGIA